MSSAEVVALKAVAGGVLVCVFALIGQVTSPKRFSGLFCAAPSVALASLLVTQLDKGADAVRLSGIGMIAGGLAFLAYTASAAPSVRRLGALRGTTASLAVWFAVVTVGLAAVR